MGSYSPTMHAVVKHLHEHGEIPEKVEGTTVRSTTVEGLRRRGALDKDLKLTEDVGLPLAKSLSENLDQPRSTSSFRINFNREINTTFDVGVTNYEFWDRARRGAAEGLEIAGLFLKPLASKKAAWVLGQSPSFGIADNADAESLVNTWYAKAHSSAVMAMEESANLGDMYLMVNPDMSVTLIPPNVVVPIVRDDDYSTQVGWEVTQVFQNPRKVTDKMSIIDEFKDDERVRTVKHNGTVIRRKTYGNPLGIVPLVHIPNNVRAGEKFGHPEGESLLHVLWNYTEVFKAAIEGNIKQGRPVPSFEKMGAPKHLQFFMEKFASKRTQTDAYGNKKTYYEMDFSDMVVLGENAEFNFKSPGSFSKDTEVLLGLMFYLIVQHTEMPEFVFGNAIASSKASAESQMEPFVKWIEKERGRAEKWLMELMRIVLAYLSLTEPAVNGTEEFDINWQSLTESDGQLTLDSIEFAYDRGLISDEVAIRNLQRFMTIKDAQAMLDQIDADREVQRQRDEQPFIPAPADIANDDTEESEPSEMREVAAKYEGIDFSPSKGMYDEAVRALGWREEHGRGGTEVGVATASTIIRTYENKQDISPDKWRHIARYFPRHEVDKEADGYRLGEDGYPSNGRISWALWGGDASKSRSNSIVEQMNNRDEREKVVRDLLSEGKHTGVMVAFEVDLDTATNLASAVKQVGIEDGVSPEDMHITLAYLGDMDELDTTKKAIADEIELMLSWYKESITGSIGGIGRFNASENSGGKDVLYASYDSPNIGRFRERICSCIRDAGGEVSQSHGFTPHITLAYIDKDDAMPNLALETTELSFDRVTLYWGDERIHFELNKPEPVRI